MITLKHLAQAFKQDTPKLRAFLRNHFKEHRGRWQWERTDAEYSTIWRRLTEKHGSSTLPSAKLSLITPSPIAASPVTQKARRKKTTP